MSDFIAVLFMVEFVRSALSRKMEYLEVFIKTRENKCNKVDN